MSYVRRLLESAARTTQHRRPSAENTSRKVPICKESKNQHLVAGSMLIWPRVGDPHSNDQPWQKAYKKHQAVEPRSTSHYNLFGSKDLSRIIKARTKVCGPSLQLWHS